MKESLKGRSIEEALSVLIAEELDLAMEDVRFAAARDFSRHFINYFRTEFQNPPIDADPIDSLREIVDGLVKYLTPRLSYWRSEDLLEAVDDLVPAIALATLPGISSAEKVGAWIELLITRLTGENPVKVELETDSEE